MARRHAPAAERNREPLLEVLRTRVGRSVLEVASGTGQHARFFTDHLDVTWQPTDVDGDALVSIAAWREGARDGFLAPHALDVHGDWPSGPFSTVIAINLVHISPWSATQALLRGAAGVLEPGGSLLLYGPYKVGGQHTAPSNARFEEWLHARDPAFGVRDVEAVEEEAHLYGLGLVEQIAMPANNFVLRFSALP